MQVMCLAFPQYTVNKRSSAGPLEEKMAIIKNEKNKNEQKWRSVQGMEEKGGLQEQGILQQCF